MLFLDLIYRIYHYVEQYRVCRFAFRTLAKAARTLSQMAMQMCVHNGFINSDFSQEDFNKNKEILNRWEKEEPKSIRSMTWFVPAFGLPHAGIHNILEFVKYLLDKGVNINLVLLGNAFDAQYSHYWIRKNEEFAWLGKAIIFENPRIAKLPHTDAGIATRCDTAYSLLKYNNTKSKFYFIQDDERLFFQDKAKRDLAEATYRFGFIVITNAEALKAMYIKEFGGKAESYFPAPNHIEPAEDLTGKRIKRLFFYARPEPSNSRNGFTLGIGGLREIKKRHPEIEIVAAGSAADFDDHGLKIKQLGQLPYSELQEFYSSCDVGIYILLSKHTGVIPFELMASGCAVLTNKRHYQQSYLRHMENCVMFDLTPSSIADAFDTLYDNAEIYTAILAGGLDFIKRMPTLEQEMNRIYSFMLK